MLLLATYKQQYVLELILCCVWKEEFTQMTGSN